MPEKNSFDQLIKLNLEALFNVTSFILGSFASFIAWFVTTHVIKPTVVFSDEVADYELPSGDRLFQCVFKNVGRRPIVDVEIDVRFCIDGFRGTNDKAFFSVRSNASRIPELVPGKRRKVRIFDAREGLEILDALSPVLRTGVDSCGNLYEILMLNRGSYFRVHVFGYDAFTGVRKHFKSKPYNLGDIWKGRFEDMIVVPNLRVDEYRAQASD